MNITHKIDDPDSIATTYYEVVLSYTWNRAKRQTMTEPGWSAHVSDVAIQTVTAIVANGVRFVPTGDTARLVERLEQYADQGELGDACMDRELALLEEANERRAEARRYG